ncbi:MAG: GTP cyclohydrolase II RibA [Pseudomonadota bacterium]
MFSYIDKEFNKILEEKNKAILIDRFGKLVTDSNKDNLSRPLYNILGPIPLPINLNNHQETFNWYVFVKHMELNSIQNMANEIKKGKSNSLFELINSYLTVNSILTLGNFATSNSPLVRLHSCCITGDVFGSLRCDCQNQLIDSLKLIASEKEGALIYLSSHEGRGIGLYAKAATYLLQDIGLDTYEANEKMGLPADSRDFHQAASIIKYFRTNLNIRLISNNPLKKEHLSSEGIIIDEMVSIITGINDINKNYIKAKATAGHYIKDEDIVNSAVK